jgi:uncharacterized protein (TIGR00251 family)
MIAITETAAGCVLAVRAQPGAKRTGVVGEHNGALKVAVAAPPTDGRANEALIEALAAALSVKRGQVELLSGQTGRDKRFLIRGLARSELEGRIGRLLTA